MNKISKILICGVFHLGETNDLVKKENHKSLETLVQESKTVVDHLSLFNPKAIAVELDYAYQDNLDEAYHSYLNNKQFKRSEIRLLGFHLAENLNHEKIYAVDDMSSREDNRGMGAAMMHAKEHQPELYERIIHEVNVLKKNVSEKNPNYTMIEALKEINQESILTNQKVTMLLSKIDVDGNLIGAKWLEWWLRRNVVIAGRVSNLADKHGDTLLFIGSNHVDIITKFLNDMGYETIPALAYL